MANYTFYKTKTFTAKVPFALPILCNEINAQYVRDLLCAEYY